MSGSLNNILVYQQGGRLVLDELFRAQPSEATISITSLGGQVLSGLGDFADVTNAPCDVSAVVITLPTAIAHVKNLVPSATAGYDADIDDFTDPGYRLLVNRGGRLQWAAVNEYELSGSNVTRLRFDDGFDFALTAGDTARGVRVKYDVDWSAVTSKFVGQVKAVWKVTVNGKVQTHVRLYDIVRQVLHCPAGWDDVVARRPDLDGQTQTFQDKQALVQLAWEDVIADLRNRQILFNMVVPDGSTILRDATVFQVLYNLTAQGVLNVPEKFLGGIVDYLDFIRRERDRVLGDLTLIVDEDEDGLVSSDEVHANRPVYLRGRSAKQPQFSKTAPN